MEKKNTMLLTVIAVATLLVAVVGATFAFFSLQVTGTSETNGTVTAAKVGTATISTVTENAKLSLTAEDMAKYEEDKVYYASVNGTTPGTETPISIATMDYKGGETGTTYKCPVQVEVSVSGSMQSVLVEGWTELILQGQAVNVSAAGPTSSVPGTKVEDGKLKVDVVTALAAGAGAPQQGERKATYKGEVTVTGPDMEATDILSASLSLKNLASTDQSVIADKDLVVTIGVVPDGACTLQTTD